jgi:hypothetical protein
MASGIVRLSPVFLIPKPSLPSYAMLSPDEAPTKCEKQAILQERQRSALSAQLRHEEGVSAPKEGVVQGTFLFC